MFALRAVFLDCAAVCDSVDSPIGPILYLGEVLGIP